MSKISSTKSINLLINFIVVFITPRIYETAPTNEEVQPPPDEQEQKIDYEAAVEKIKNELELQPLELTSYSVEIGVKLTRPTHANSAVSEFVTIEGIIEQHELLKENIVWIKVKHSGDSLADNAQEYYAPIQDGKFKQEVTLFKGVEY